MKKLRKFVQKIIEVGGIAVQRLQGFVPQIEKLEADLKEALSNGGSLSKALAEAKVEIAKLTLAAATDDAGKSAAQTALDVATKALEDLVAAQEAEAKNPNKSKPLSQTVADTASSLSSAHSTATDSVGAHVDLIASSPAVVNSIAAIPGAVDTIPGTPVET